MPFQLSEYFFVTNVKGTCNFGGSEHKFLRDVLKCHLLSECQPVVAVQMKFCTAQYDQMG